MRFPVPLRRRLGELAALAVLAFAAVAAHAAAPGPQPLDEIRAAAISAMSADGASAEAMLDPALRLARCRQPLQATATGPNTAQVRCTDTPGWRLYVPVRVRREADVVVLAAPAPAGVPLAAHQLIVQRRETGALDGTPFGDPAQLVGRVPVRALAAGLVPTADDLVTGTPLRRGDPVVLVARAGGVEVRVQGRALGPPQAGGRIAVENIASHRVLRGRVAGDGVVEVLP